MVIRIQLTVKHIRGNNFQVEANADSDVLGLKVQIWESQKIAIENQRLVFNGKELSDNVKFKDAGIVDNSIVFLVEANPEVPQVPTTSQNVTVEMPQVTQECVTHCQRKVRPLNQYQRIEDEVVVEQLPAEERIKRIINLGYWIRKYFLLGMILFGISSFGCLYCLIPFTLYVLGMIGARKLNRCLLVFPLMLTMFFGFGFSGMSIYWMASSFYGYELIVLLVGLLHLMIFSCICKFMCSIGHLNALQIWYVRTSIIRRHPCTLC